MKSLRFKQTQCEEEENEESVSYNFVVCHFCEKISLIHRSIKLLLLLHVQRIIHMKENLLTRSLALSLPLCRLYEVMKALEIMTVVANDDFLLAFSCFRLLLCRCCYREE